MTEVLFVDLKNAFDTVDFRIFLQKLQLSGTYCLTLKWFSSYLTNRKQNSVCKWTYYPGT